MQKGPECPLYQHHFKMNLHSIVQRVPATFDFEDPLNNKIHKNYCSRNINESILFYPLREMHVLFTMFGLGP